MATDRIETYVRHHNIGEICKTEQNFITVITWITTQYEDIFELSAEQLVWVKFLYPLFNGAYQEQKDVILYAKQIGQIACFNINHIPCDWKNCSLYIKYESINNLLPMTTIFLTELGILNNRRELNSNLHQYIIQLSEPIEHGSVISFVDQPSTESYNIYWMWQQHKLCDFTIFAKNRQFPVHKIVLYLRGGTYFSTIFDDEHKHQELTISDISVDMILVYINFIYTGESQNIDPIELFKLVYDLGQETLIKICLNLLNASAGLDSLKQLQSTNPHPVLENMISSLEGYDLDVKNYIRRHDIQKILESPKIFNRAYMKNHNSIWLEILYSILVTAYRQTSNLVLVAKVPDNSPTLIYVLRDDFFDTKTQNFKDLSCTLRANYLIPVSKMDLGYLYQWLVELGISVVMKEVSGYHDYTYYLYIPLFEHISPGYIISPLVLDVPNGQHES